MFELSEDGTGLTFDQVPLAEAYFHTSPCAPSYGPPVSLYETNRFPPVASSTALCGTMPVGWPPILVQVEPPSSERYTLFCLSATPTNIVRVTPFTVPLPWSNTSHRMPSGSLW